MSQTTCNVNTLGKLFRIGLNKLQSLPFWISQMKQYGLDGFKFEIMQKKHYNDVYDMLGSQMTKSAGNTGSVIFNIQETEKTTYTRYTHMISWGIKTGLAYVVIDPQGNVGGAHIIMDICNKPARISYSDYPMKYTKRGEFTHYVESKHTFFKMLPELMKYGLIKKGNCVQHEFGVTRRDLMGTKGLFYMAGAAGIMTLFSIKSVKYYSVPSVSHPATVKMMMKLHHHFNRLEDNDEDKISFYTRVMNTKMFFMEKFKTDEWYQLNVDEKFIIENINKIKIGCQVQCYHRLRQKYTIKQFFAEYIQSVDSKSKL
eukprot:245865_1